MSDPLDALRAMAEPKAPETANPYDDYVTKKRAREGATAIIASKAQPDQGAAQALRSQKPEGARLKRW